MDHHGDPETGSCNYAYDIVPCKRLRQIWSAFPDFQIDAIPTYSNPDYLIVCGTTIPDIQHYYYTVFVKVFPSG